MYEKRLILQVEKHVIFDTTHPFYMYDSRKEKKIHLNNQIAMSFSYDLENFQISQIQ